MEGGYGMEKLVFHEMIDKTYIGIVTILDYELVVRKCLTEITFPSEKNNKRKIIVDLALKTGINEYRFVTFDINSDGKILWNSNAYIKPDDKIVNYANELLKEKKEIIAHSMLPNAKKKELLNV